jgi:hypothetical protein
MMKIGLLDPGRENAGGTGVGYPTKLDELRKLGFSEGRNLAVEYRTVEQDRRAIFAGVAEAEASFCNDVLWTFDRNAKCSRNPGRCGHPFRAECSSRLCALVFG